MNKKIVPFEFVQVTNIVPESMVSYQVYVNGDPKPCVIDEDAIDGIYNAILKSGIKELAKYFIDRLWFS